MAADSAGPNQEAESVKPQIAQIAQMEGCQTGLKWWMRTRPAAAPIPFPNQSLS